VRAFAKNLPRTVIAPLRNFRNLVRRIQYSGKGRYCPVCKKSSCRFAPAGLDRRNDALCVHCGSLERHRLLWLYVTRRTTLFDGRAKNMLHVAPESCFEPILRQRLGDGYLTADLFDPDAMVQMDIMNLQYPDRAFDVIYCSHVLEHVQDDRKALREFYRVLRNDGWAILLVPIVTGVTIEDPAITDPAERLRVFGQEDHVRRYGKDYIDRLREAGFTVDVTTVEELVHADEAFRMGLSQECGEIYYCTKPVG